MEAQSKWTLGVCLAVWVLASGAHAQLEFDPELVLGPPADLPEAPSPVLERLPSRTPYPRLPVRGRVPVSEEGQISTHVIVHGPSKPAVIRTAVGSFCGEVAFDKPGRYTLEFRSQDVHGTVSKAVHHVVEYAPEAPGVPWIRNCAGTDELGQCEPSREHCTNTKDDDCDGLADRQDPDCDRQCVDDALELRDGSVPYLSYGTTERLRLCKGTGGAADVDRFGAHVRAGHALLLGVKAAGATSSNPVKLRLSGPGRSTVVVQGAPSNEKVSLGFFPSQLGTEKQARNIEFEVSEVNGRAVEYELYVDIVPVDPAQDLAAQQAQSSENGAAAQPSNEADSTGQKSGSVGKKSSQKKN